MPRTGAWLMSNPVRISIHVSPDMKESTRSKILSEQNHHEDNPWLVLSPYRHPRHCLFLAACLTHESTHRPTSLSHESLYHGGQTKPTTQTLDYDLFIRHHGEGEYKVFANLVNSTPGQPANHARRPGPRGYQAPASHPLGMWVNSNCPLTAPTQDGPWSFCRLQHTSAFPHVWRSDEYEWLSVDRASKQRSSNLQAFKAVCISMLATDSGVFLARLMHFASSRHLSNVTFVYLGIQSHVSRACRQQFARGLSPSMGLFPLLRDAHRAPSSFHKHSLQSPVTLVNHTCFLEEIGAQLQVSVGGGAGARCSLAAILPPLPESPLRTTSHRRQKANTSAGRCPPWHFTVHYALVMPRKPMSSLEIFSQRTRLHRDISETVSSVWYGHISGLPARYGVQKSTSWNLSVLSAFPGPWPAIATHHLAGFGSPRVFLFRMYEKMALLRIQLARLNDSQSAPYASQRKAGASILDFFIYPPMPPGNILQSAACKPPCWVGLLEKLKAQRVYFNSLFSLQATQTRWSSHSGKYQPTAELQNQVPVSDGRHDRKYAEQPKPHGTFTAAHASAARVHLRPLASYVTRCTTTQLGMPRCVSPEHRHAFRHSFNLERRERSNNIHEAKDDDPPHPLPSRCGVCPGNTAQRPDRAGET
ncbi:uncharacterized protein CLUP02_01160 [Colletotrichum lupini]|uniref:Uncharacterized protein n=1 Tax=Colletotrichum lupini TaxID=145971 RepID=A0A9Q8SBU2_9PEZI|nr:uncharacterized protein CLUP02_01160 [Colletotrichum lupini]UQC74509.1 hypothetical protein CLUP02_01160 [Colletotrichum lupini]